MSEPDDDLPEEPTPVYEPEPAPVAVVPSEPLSPDLDVLVGDAGHQVEILRTGTRRDRVRANERLAAVSAKIALLLAN